MCQWSWLRCNLWGNRCLSGGWGATWKNRRSRVLRCLSLGEQRYSSQAWCPERLWERATWAERRSGGPRSGRPQRAERPPSFIVADRCWEVLILPIMVWMRDRLQRRSLVAFGRQPSRCKVTKARLHFNTSLWHLSRCPFESLLSSEENVVFALLSEGKDGRTHPHLLQSESTNAKGKRYQTLNVWSSKTCLLFPHFSSSWFSNASPRASRPSCRR